MIAIMFASIFMGCKKGENDPTLSLSSRKARITGEWKMSAADYVNKTENSTYTYSFSDETGVMTESYTYGSVSYTDNYTHSCTLTINKDNSFKQVEVDTDNGTTTTTTEGYWFFAPKNKDLDLKNKEAVVFQTTKVTTVDDDGDSNYDTYSGTTNSHTNIIQLDELSKKQITVKLNYTHTDEDGFVYSQTGTQTFIQE